jgi:hypothetical protein
MPSEIPYALDDHRRTDRPVNRNGRADMSWLPNLVVFLTAGCCASAIALARALLGATAIRSSGGGERTVFHSLQRVEDGRTRQEGSEPLPDSVYIAELRIDPSVESKIKEKHNVNPYEAREAFVLRGDVRAGWEDHPAHGRRLIALGTTYADRRILGVLVPLDAAEGIWKLVTAREPK